MLERIIHTRICNYLQENKIFYSKQLGFSTENAIIQLVEQIYENFEKNKYTLGVFIDLTKPLLLIYGIGGITLKWSENYLTNRKPDIQIRISKAQI